MSYPSRHQSLRRAYIDASDSGHATYDDCEAAHREYRIDEAHSALSSHRSSISHVHAGNIAGRGCKITVASHRVHTSGDFTTSYQDCREYTAYDSHRSPPGYRNDEDGYRDRTRLTVDGSRMPEASSRRSGTAYTYSERSGREFPRMGAQRDDSSSFHTMPAERTRGPQSSAEQRRRYSSRREGDPRSNGNEERYHQEVPKPSHPKKPGPTHTDGQSGTSKSYRNHEYAMKDHATPGKPNPKPSQPKKPRPTHTDGQSGTSKSYRNHEYATKDRSSPGKANGGSRRRQEKTHSRRGEDLHGGSPKSHRNDSFHENGEQEHRQDVPQSKAEESMPDHYAILKISPHATGEVIKSAAKRRRVEVHPDKLKEVGMSDSERADIDAAAAKVGQAADVLQDAELKLKYDRQMYAASPWKWHGN